jgi:hypothetical protein
MIGLQARIPALAQKLYFGFAGQEMLRAAHERQ